MERVAEREGLKLAMQWLGPLMTLLGLVGALGALGTLADWLNRPWVLQALLISSGIAICLAGYRERLAYCINGLVAAGMNVRLAQHSGADRLSAARGEVDRLIERAQREAAIRDWEVPSFVRHQWVRHVQAAIRRLIKQVDRERELASFRGAVGQDLEWADNPVYDEPFKDEHKTIINDWGYGPGMKWLHGFRERLNEDNVRMD